MIRSLCEVEFTLDEVAAELQRSMAAARFAAARDDAGGDGLPARRDSVSMDQMRGKLPSYVSLATYGDDEAEHGRTAYPMRDEANSTGGRGRSKMPGVASHASLLNLASLDLADDEPMPSTGMAPFAA